MKRRLSDEQVEKVVNELQGTCMQSIDDVVRNSLEVDPSELTQEDYKAIEEHIFECFICGWWFEDSERTEVNGEQCCRQCAEDAEIFDYEGYEGNEDDEEWCYDCDHHESECEC
jgi:hypothetical protein